MAKTKSPATLLKEEKWKKDVAYWRENSKKTPTWIPSFNYVAHPGKLTAPPNVIAKNIRLDSRIAGYLWQQFSLFASHPYALHYKPAHSYISGDFLQRWGKFTNATLVMSQPVLLPSQIQLGALKLTAKRGSPDLASYVLSCPFTHNAVAMTWPDDMGVSKIYMHVSSRLASQKYPKLYVKDDGLNRQAFANLKTWPLLAEYITSRTSSGMPVAQRAVCDIVKSISMNIAADELKSMAKHLNG
jgi:hypothetical protein